MKRSQRLQNNTDPLFRFRLSVPTGDMAVLEWISRQHNLSFSLRQLIREAVENKGFRDAFDNDLKDLEANEKKGRRSEKVILKEIAEPELPLGANKSVSEPPVLEVAENNLVENNLPRREISNESALQLASATPPSAREKLNEMLNL